MKKAIILLIPVIFVLQSCINLKADDKHYYFELPAEDWVTITPIKEVYKVGDTIDVVYKIPSDLSKYAVKNTTEDLIRGYGKADNLMLHHYNDTSINNKSNIDEFVRLEFIRDNYDKSTEEQMIKVLINDKEYEKGDDILYHFDNISNEYKLKISFIPLKPSIFYLKNENEKSKSLLPFQFTDIGVVLGDNEIAYNNEFNFLYNVSNDITFTVVE